MTAPAPTIPLAELLAAARQYEQAAQINAEQAASLRLLVPAAIHDMLAAAVATSTVTATYHPVTHVTANQMIGVADYRTPGDSEVRFYLVDEQLRIDLFDSEGTPAVELWIGQATAGQISRALDLVTDIPHPAPAL